MKETGVSHDKYSDAHDFFKILHNHKFECTLSRGWVKPGAGTGSGAGDA